MNINKLGELCKKIADTMPIDTGSRSTENTPWGCIHSVQYYEWYCDKCPVREICPLQQHYSK